jgi:serine protease
MLLWIKFNLNKQYSKKEGIRMGRLCYSRLNLKFVGLILIAFIVAVSVVEVSNAANSGQTGSSVSKGKPVITSVPPFYSGQVVIAGAPQTIPAEYTVIKYLPHANLTVVAVAPGKERGHIVSLMAKGHRADFNLQYKIYVNDPDYEYQWHFPMVQSDEAWTINKGLGVTVAVLDTGLAEGPDGIGCVVGGYNAVADPPDNNPTDGHGHGTHVSGTIAQRTNNGIGVAGLAYESCIMPVKVCNDDGNCSSADMADGIYYAVANGAKVINMSLGDFTITNDTIVDPALDEANTQGVTVVCASGNDGSFDHVSYPAIYPTTIAVGGVAINSEFTPYSNEGVGLDIMAPGGYLGWIPQLCPGSDFFPCQDVNGDGKVDGVLQETFLGMLGEVGWGYYPYQGTSMASPHVAAVAAMLYSHGTASNPAGVYQALTSTAQDLHTSGFDIRTGFGLVQAFDALNYSGGGGCDEDGDGYVSQACGGGDCNDNDATVNPGANEVCDGKDNDCDGAIDEDGVCTGSTDNDGDGWHYTEINDCNDADSTVYPGAPELCDGKDNDCDGAIDEDGVCGGGTDVDGDGYTESDGDCNDTDDTVYPGAVELCDGKDNDCDGAIPADELDGDGDGVRICEGDCNDDNPEIYPGHTDKGRYGRDGVDNDCSGVADDG